MGTTRSPVRNRNNQSTATTHLSSTAVLNLVCTLPAALPPLPSVPEPTLSASPSMRRVRSLSRNAGASIMGEGTTAGSRQGSRPATGQQQQQHHQQQTAGSRPQTGQRNVADSSDAFAVQYATNASMSLDNLDQHAAAANEHHGLHVDTSQHTSAANSHRTPRGATGVSHGASQVNSKRSSQSRLQHSPTNSMSAAGVSSGSNPNWKATKGGGGGLIKIDPERKTVTTLAGTVLQDGSANSSRRSSIAKKAGEQAMMGTSGSASSGRRKWDKNNPSVPSGGESVY